MEVEWECHVMEGNLLPAGECHGETLAVPCEEKEGNGRLKSKPFLHFAAISSQKNDKGKRKEDKLV